jgi:hypothetical protein
MKTTAWAALAAASLMGCASPVLKLPSDSPVTVTVLSDARQSEMGMGDYLIPGSQVYVAGNLSGAPNLGMKFNGIVFEALRTEPANAGARGPRLRVVRANDRDAAIELEPVARVTNEDVLFILNANFDVAGVRGRLNRISYAQAGRTGPDFHASAQRAFVRLTDVFKADLRGELKRDASLKSVRWESADKRETRSGLLLYEQPDYVAVIPAGERTALNSTLIIDRSQLRGS